MTKLKKKGVWEQMGSFQHFLASDRKPSRIFCFKFNHFSFALNSPSGILRMEKKMHS